jgi:oligopeptidase A
MTAHVDTGEPLPRALFDKMVAAKNFQSGLQTLRQVEFALFDMRLHARVRAGRRPDRASSCSTRCARDRRGRAAGMFNRFPHSFSHIFAGGYAAGYYSYKWAEVLSADAYAAFEEAGERTGSRARHETGGASGTKFSPSAAAARRWNRSRPSVAANHGPMRCCATAA